MPATKDKYRRDLMTLVGKISNRLSRVEKALSIRKKRKGKPVVEEEEETDEEEEEEEEDEENDEDEDSWL